MEKIRCYEHECVHNGGECDCFAEHVLVNHEDDNAKCSTFDTGHTADNTAAERMLGDQNAVIGDGKMTMDYFRVEFAEAMDAPGSTANATVGCTASNCKHNDRYVCGANSITVGESGENSYFSPCCKNYEDR